MFTKLIHFLKMSWMLTWRLLVFGAIFLGSQHNDILLWVAIGTSAVLVFGFNKTLRTWPLIRLIAGGKAFLPANSWGEASRPVRQAPNRTPRRGPGRPNLGTPGGIQRPSIVGHVASATNNGRISGFEPKALESMAVPNSVSMTGAPGAGLHGAKGMSQTNIDLGVKGEENFAKALSLTGQLDRFKTVWSVPVPAQNSFVPGPYGTDIDCVLFTDSAIFLVDLKNYKSGDVRYFSHGEELFCEDGATHKQVGEVKVMTRNMEMATNAVRNYFPHYNIVPVVVFMPTDKGEGVLDNVTWPGGITAMNLTEFLSVLANQQSFDWNATAHAGAVGQFGQLLRMGASKV